MAKQDYKKDARELYLPPAQPTLIDVPPLSFVTMTGSGDPNTSPAFAGAVQGLYSVSYGLKMLPKKGVTPPGYEEYTVFPLEGLWDSVDGGRKPDGTLDKAGLTWQVMIRQPAFVTPELFATVLEAAARKKNAPPLDGLKLETITDGLSVQMLHVGPYDSEPASFALMDEFCRAEGLVRVGHVHREIYLSDPGRVAPEKMRTTIRYFVRRDE